MERRGRNLLVQPKDDCCSHSPAAHAGHEPNAPSAVIDPVCGMRVNPATAAGHYDYRGTTYYFCGLSCLERFKAAPESFLGAPEAHPASSIEAGEYVCPMDPEVRQDHPGACPKTFIRPALGASWPRIARISVVLPAPFGPSTPMNSPGSMSKLTSDSTARPPS